MIEHSDSYSFDCGYDYVEFFRNYGGDRNAVYESIPVFAEILSNWSKCMIFVVFVYRIGVNV